MKAIGSVVGAVMALAIAVLPIAALCEAVPMVPDTVVAKPLPEVRPLARASELIGMPVRNIDGSLKGVVRDVVLNDPRTHVDHLIVSFSELNRYDPIRFGDLRITPDGGTLVYEISRANLLALPGVDRAVWVSQRDAHRVSTLIGLAVNDRLDKRVGSLHDLLISGESGRVMEATVAIHGFFGLGRKLASVEWISVMLPMLTESATVSLTRDEIESIAYRPTEYWQRLGFSGPPSEPMKPFETPEAYPLHEPMGWPQY